MFANMIKTGSLLERAKYYADKSEITTIGIRTFKELFWDRYGYAKQVQDGSPEIFYNIQNQCHYEEILTTGQKFLRVMAREIIATSEDSKDDLDLHFMKFYLFNEQKR